MIYTLTLNPSLDYVMDVKHFQPKKINRSFQELLFPGGKGINVSQILHRLGITSRIFGFRAGFTGDTLEKLLLEQGLIPDLTPIDTGMTRINVKIRSQEETAINGIGPVIDEVSYRLLFDKFDQLQTNDILVMAGNLPKGVDSHLYETIMKHLKHKEIRFVVDTSGAAFGPVLAHQPFLVKPNVEELAEFFKTTIETQEDIVTYAKKLQAHGAKNILISMGEDGAILYDEDQNLSYCPSPRATVKNTVGAGDSMVAGFLYGYLTYHDYKKALFCGVACGSATAFSDGLAEKPLLQNLINTILGGSYENY